MRDKRFSKIEKERQKKVPKMPCKVHCMTKQYFQPLAKLNIICKAKDRERERRPMQNT